MPMQASPASLLIGQRGEILKSDAFQRQYVSNPLTLLDYFSKYGLDDREIDEDTATGGTVSNNLENSSVDLDVTSSSGSRATVCSKTYHRYQAGRGQDVIITCFFSDSGQSNQLRRWGYYDREAGDGVGFQLDETTFGIFRLTSVSGESDEIVTAANFNVRPNYSIDHTTLNIFELDLQWLGGGLVRYYINGDLVHVMENPNKYDAVYMRTGTLPVMASIENSGASAAATMTFTCFSVTSQGGDAFGPDYAYAALNDSDVSIGNSTLKGILAIRPTSTLNTVDNRITVIPKSMFIENESGRMRWRLIFNPTYGATPSWTSVGGESGVEYSLNPGGNSGVSGGELILAGFAADSRSFERIDLTPFFGRLTRKLRNPLYADRETLVIAAIKDGGGSANVRASITWGEIR